MDNSIYKLIRYVAIYLRKSRNELGEKDVLMKHRIQLVDFAESYGWEYDIFEEIGSSDDIEFREQFKLLLTEVENGKYDAVLVIDFDRITRGDSYDYGYIKRMFSKYKTPIFTPYGEIIDLSDELNVMNDMKATMGRYELIQSKKRLREGKIRSAKLGNWVNGTPPLGYDYNHKTKKLDINEKQAETVRLIFKMYDEEDKSMEQIGFELNQLGHRSKRNDFFSVNKIQRILRNQTYIGRIVFGKSEGSGHLKKKTKPLRFKDETEWLVVKDDCHPAIISKELFDRVQIRMNKRQRVPVKARQAVFTLSGLLRCKHCNSGLRFNDRKLKTTGRTLYVIKCQKKNPFGERCSNCGCNVLPLLIALEAHIDEYWAKLLANRKVGKNDSVDRLHREIEVMNKELKRLEVGKQRIKEMFIEGLIESKQERDERMNAKEEEIKIAAKKLRLFEKELNSQSNDSIDSKIAKIEEIRNNFKFDNPFDNEMNLLLREVIDHIQYEKNGDQIIMNVVFF